MQRQRLPSKLFSIAAALSDAPPSAAAAASSADMAPTQPGVQKPHCEPWPSAIARCASEKPRAWKAREKRKRRGGNPPDSIEGSSGRLAQVKPGDRLA